MISGPIFDDYKWQAHARLQGQASIDLGVAAFLIGLLLAASSFRQEAAGPLQLSSATLRSPTLTVPAVDPPGPKLRLSTDPYATAGPLLSLPSGVPHRSHAS